MNSEPMNETNESPTARKNREREEQRRVESPALSRDVPAAHEGNLRDAMITACGGFETGNTTNTVVAVDLLHNLSYDLEVLWCAMDGDVVPLGRDAIKGAIGRLQARASGMAKLLDRLDDADRADEYRQEEARNEETYAELLAHRAEVLAARRAFIALVAEIPKEGAPGVVEALPALHAALEALDARVGGTGDPTPIVARPPASAGSEEPRPNAQTSGVYRSPDAGESVSATG